MMKTPSPHELNDADGDVAPSSTPRNTLRHAAPAARRQQLNCAARQAAALVIDF